MLRSAHSDGPKPKAIVSINKLSNYINEDEPPTKTEPFRTVLENDSGYTLSLLVAGADSRTALTNILSRHGTLQYCKVFMKLSDIVSGEFFNNYIKTNNISMRSEGRTGIDDLFTLHAGILRLQVDKPTFERLGLEGKAILSNGRKHVEARYAIELNLRLPAMVRGRKGFERVLRAFGEVLDETKTWIFYNVQSPGDFSGPIAAFQPIVRTVTPELRAVTGVGELDLEAEALKDDHDTVLEVMEWLSMLVLESPRLRFDDTINPYLSRYAVPTMVSRAASSAQPGTVHLAEYHGYLHTDFIRHLLIALLKKRSAFDWFSMTVDTFDRRSYTLLKMPTEMIVSKFNN